MKLWYLTCVLLASFAVIWAASGEEESEEQEESEATKLPRQQHDQGFKIVSFDAVGKNIALGLDYLVPFLEVPVKRKRNAPPKPLVIINSAALLSCGLVAAGGIFVGHLIRSLGLEAITGDAYRPIFGNSSNHKPKSSEEMTTNTMAPQASNNATSRGFFEDEYSLPKIFENFKLVYKNETGDRVATSLPNILNTIERTFLKNDVDLSTCLLKSICTLTRKAGDKVRQGQATDMEHLLDNATSWSWLLSWLEQSAFREAIDAGKVSGPHHCSVKYPECKWAVPEDKIEELVRNNVQFK
ncbi:uncharacterized protein LOC6499001 [Drosophila ananassae]|uniref:uncharacterized protein LOC6499001 n=1 Tax=Drosophila ananassae TaxID=7217 RepID=UPI0013A5C7DF|nr:uncharacterized protein LOC6499001 [Drosophila ananassae]